MPHTRKQRKEKKKHRFSFIGLLGELLLTAGAVTLLFVFWQLWFNDYIMGQENNQIGAELSQQWDDAAPALPEDFDPAVPVDPIILPEPADTEIFGLLRVPRFGDDYKVRTAGGVTRAGTLDTIGIGHQPGTAMPGAEGNMVIAGHRWGQGAAMFNIDKLQLGDAIVVETPVGWYTYRYRNTEYVKDNDVDVMIPVPKAPGRTGGKYMTIISCSPLWNVQERIIAYAVFEEFTPRAAGEPASLASVTS